MLFYLLFFRTEKRLKGQGGCQLIILLLFEFVGDSVIAALLPINAMRNAALLPAMTPLVAMIDVDLLTSASLSTGGSFLDSAGSHSGSDTNAG